MKSYLINLDRGSDRLAVSAKLFADAGLAFERVPAVDGKALSRARRSEVCPPVRFYLANAHRALPGEIGCVLSHLAAWRTAFAGYVPAAAFFEDDISFDAEGLRRALASIERDDDPAVPTVWLLHAGLPRPADEDGRAWYDIRETADVGHAFWASSYALNAAAARRLAAILTPMANVADAWSTFARCGVRVLALFHPCAGQRRNDASSISKRPSFLWRQSWYRRLHWFRWRIAFRLDLLLKRFEGKRYRIPSPA